MRSGGALLTGSVMCLWLCTAACYRDHNTAAVLPAVYHWKTVFSPDSTEQVWLRENEMRRVYVKFFDVDLDAREDLPTPRASVVLPAQLYPDTDYVPCVFITNRVFSRIGETETDELATRVWDKVLRMVEQSGALPFPREIQIDCDWTGSTREAYFRFLTQLRKNLTTSNIQLSVTIRLHQAKFPEETGIPPVDRGMLMFYNIGNLSDLTTSNSILNRSAAEQYLSDYSDYPLPLDLALPIFRWGVLFRDEKLIRLINNLEAAALSDTAFFRKDAPHRYTVQKSTYLEGYYLYSGDQLRLEGIRTDLLLDVAALIKPRLAPDSFHLAFYHLDPETIKDFPHDSIQLLLQLFETP